MMIIGFVMNISIFFMLSIFIVFSIHGQSLKDLILKNLEAK